MEKRTRTARSALLVVGAITLFAGCSRPAPAPAPDDAQSVTVAAKPTDITVLVNKAVMLPDGYKPSDLVEPNVPFIFTEKDEKRLMRPEAAHWYFGAADHQGTPCRAFGNAPGQGQVKPQM